MNKIIDIKLPRVWNKEKHKLIEVPKIAQVPLTYEYAYGGKKITDNPSTEAL